MPRLIFKCPYIQGGSKKAAVRLNNYVRYVATREGARQISGPEASCDQAARKENYVQYIASRPRAQRTGSHALFTGSDETPILSKVAEEVANHPGSVWLPILSLHREDAARLGYDDARRWRDLLTSYAMEMAQAMKIPWDQFRWYAAFHDEGHHPHVHMVCYSADGTSGYLTKQGIADIKSGLANEIFRQELVEIYQQQTQRRDELTKQAGQAIDEFIRQMESGSLENPHIQQLMEYLAGKLKNLSGKKQYGYLKAPLKSVVDEIVDELARDPRVAQAYDLWYELREEVLRTYRNDLPERLPLSRQKEFKRIRNLVIEEAVRLGEEPQVLQPGEIAADRVHSRQEEAVRLREHSSVPYSPGRSPSLLSSGTRLLHHMANLFREQEPRLTAGPIRFTDKKLRQKIREKKIAMGHKPDDHEEPTITM